MRLLDDAGSGLIDEVGNTIGHVAEVAETLRALDRFGLVDGDERTQADDELGDVGGDGIH